MSNKESLFSVNPLPWHINEALTMMEIFESEEKENFITWLNKFEYIANVIGVREDLMLEFFYYMVNKSVHKRVKEVDPSICFNELSYYKIIIRYLHFFYPCVNDIHRSRFLSRKQYENETIQMFSDNLRKIYYNCNKIYPNDMDKELRDQFLRGIRDNDIRMILYKTPELSFDEMTAKANELSKSEIIDYFFNQARLEIAIYNKEMECEFHVWLNKFEYVAYVIDVPIEKMIELFNKMVDNDVHRCVRNAYPSNNCYDVSYSGTTEIYLLYFSPFEVDIHRPRFICRKQYERETYEQYAYGLRKIYNKCYQKYESQLEEELREQFIRGIRDNDIGTILNKFPKLSFNEIVEKAIEFSKIDLMKYFVNHALLQISIYHPKSKGLFYAWLNKFEFVANVIGVSNDRMIEFFNAMVDEDVRTNVKNHYKSVNFCNISYTQLTEYYLLYFSSLDDLDLHRTRFMCRKQFERETIKDYANNLQQIYNQFYFKASLIEILCEQFINGIRNEEIKYHLINTPGLSFDEMVAKAIQLEIEINR